MWNTTGHALLQVAPAGSLVGENITMLWERLRGQAADGRSRPSRKAAAGSRGVIGTELPQVQPPRDAKLWLCWPSLEWIRGHPSWWQSTLPSLARVGQQDTRRLIRPRPPQANVATAQHPPAHRKPQILSDLHRNPELLYLESNSNSLKEAIRVKVRDLRLRKSLNLFHLKCGACRHFHFSALGRTHTCTPCHVHKILGCDLYPQNPYHMQNIPSI